MKYLFNIFSLSTIRCLRIIYFWTTGIKLGRKGKKAWGTTGISYCIPTFLQLWVFLVVEFTHAHFKCILVYYKLGKSMGEREIRILALMMVPVCIYIHFKKAAVLIPRRGTKGKRHFNVMHKYLLETFMEVCLFSFERREDSGNILSGENYL